MSNRVLVVDDARTIRDLIVGLLRRDYEVAAAASGEEALVLARQQTPAVVLLDIMMPGIDGYETCRRLKSMFLGKGIQVIMVSAASSQEEQRRAFEVGADGYLVKPFDPCVLRSEVRLHLRLRDAVRRLVSMQAEIQSQRGNLERIVEDRDRRIAATQDIAVFALAKTAESRDENTGQHLIRVRAYSQVLAEQLRESNRDGYPITGQFLDDLYRSSPLHDIGKVGISDAILRKPGRYTPEEFEMMKIHTVLGAQVLEEAVCHSQSGSFLAMASAVARYHHERFDGTGYLAGLVGEEIPLPARIVALADVFDAITSTRTYKPGSSPLDALKIVRREAGKQFDPVLVDALEACFDKFVEIHARHGDRIPVTRGALSVLSPECPVRAL